MKDLLKHLYSRTYQFSDRDVWRDWMYAMACAISNAVDHRAAVWQAREDRYMALVGKYGKETMQVFAEAMGMLVQEMEAHRYVDMLGPAYMELGGNANVGQFFTPQHLSKLMAQMSMQDAKELVDAQGAIWVSEPACGSGGMVLCQAEEMANQGLVPARTLCAHLIDVDELCVHMAYVNLALNGVPAIVVHGNALSGETWAEWYTPVYVLDGWARRRPQAVKPVARARQRVRPRKRHRVRSEA